MNFLLILQTYANAIEKLGVLIDSGSSQLNAWGYRLCRDISFCCWVVVRSPGKPLANPASGFSSSFSFRTKEPLAKAFLTLFQVIIIQYLLVKAFDNYHSLTRSPNPAA